MRLRLLLPAVLLGLVAGCDSMLQTEPGDQLPSESAIVDGPTAHSALIGAYDALQDLSYYGNDFVVLGDLSADNADHVGTYQFLGDVDRNQIRPDNSAITGVWQAIYAAIARDNAIIQKVPDLANVDETERNEILGEAYFLRALSYHDLVKLWGDVPMPLQPAASPEEAAAYTRTPSAQVYDQILSDLDQAGSLITEETQTRQASLGAVRALRARVDLYRQDWAGAVANADSVYAMGYTLAPSYASLFTAEGTDTPEDIFRISFTAVEYNEVGYYYLWDGRNEVDPTEDLFDAYEAGDARRAWSVREDDGYFEGTKFPTTVGSEDLHVIRLAEVILIKAEALAQLGQTTQLEDAVDEYNKLRVRAGLEPHVFGVDVTNKSQVLAAIAQERRVELAFEGDRWPDLVRTGNAVSVLGIPPERAYQTLYPIPARELTVAPGLTQNPGYPGS